MKKSSFIKNYLPLAKEAGDMFRLNPVVILAQSAIESGWGTSTLSTLFHNFFGITGYGSKNDYWPGYLIKLKHNSLEFRAYQDARSSFLDYARLIRSAYPSAAEVSFFPEAFAQSIAYSKYISEVNGDNREEYRLLLVSLCRTIEELLNTDTHLEIN